MPCASSGCSALPCPGLLERLVDEGRRLAVAPVEGPLGELEPDDRVHEPLLRAVVQVPHHPAAGVVGRSEQPGPGPGQLSAGLGVRDRRRDEVRERREARLGVGRARLGVAEVRDDDGAPGPVADEHGLADGRGHAELPGPLGGVGRVRRIVVDTTGSPVAEHGLGDAVALERDRRADREGSGRGGAVDGHDAGRSRPVVAPDRAVRAEQPRGLLGHLREDLGRRRVLRDERGDPPQPRLLVGEPLRPQLRLRVCDRGPHQGR